MNGGEVNQGQVLNGLECQAKELSLDCQQLGGFSAGLLGTLEELWEHFRLSWEWGLAGIGAAGTKLAHKLSA